jgi:pilus assembly protein CpaF
MSGDDRRADRAPGSLGGLVDEVHDQLLRSPGLPTRADVMDEVRRRRPLAPGREAALVADRVLGRIQGLGPLGALLDDPEVTDVLVNGPGPAWVERAGRLSPTDVVLTTDDVERLLERVLAPLGLRVDRSSPLVDARLADGSRLSAVVPPLAIDGPCVAIRRFAVAVRPLEELCAPDVADLLRRSVAEGRNVVIAGGTGAGKTSLLGALAAGLPPGERLVTVEDVAELQLPHAHVVRLETRPASVDGIGRVGVRDLVRGALRLRPDRIIVGEVRGGEALDMLQAMNTGHDGSLTTVHANGLEDAMRRLETLVLAGSAALPLHAVREQIASAVDLVVHVVRQPGGRRAVIAVGEPRPLIGADGRVAVRELVRSGVVVDGCQRAARFGEARCS